MKQTLQKVVVALFAGLIILNGVVLAIAPGTATAQQTTNTITVTSPVAGQALSAGGQITVSWTTAGPSQFNGFFLQLARYPDGTTTNSEFVYYFPEASIQNPIIGKTQVVVTLPASIKTSGRYRIEITGVLKGFSELDSLVGAASGFFTINGQSADPAPVITGVKGATGTNVVEQNSNSNGVIVNIEGNRLVGRPGTGTIYQNNQAVDKFSYYCSSDTSCEGYIDPINKLKPGNYTASIFAGAVESNRFPFVFQYGSGYVPGSDGAPTSGNAHPAGTNVRAPNGVVYYINTQGLRMPYASAGAYRSYKFNTWENLVQANSADLALPIKTYQDAAGNTKTSFRLHREGSLVNDKGTVYLISNGSRHGFASDKVFRGLGFSYKNVYPGDTSYMATSSVIDSINRAHFAGMIINDNGTIYLLDDSGKYGIPSVAVLDRIGYWLTDAVPANSYDKQLPLHFNFDANFINNPD